MRSGDRATRWSVGRADTRRKLTPIKAAIRCRAKLLVTLGGPLGERSNPIASKPAPKANYDAWPKVEEVAATILFLASPENRVTRGAVVSAYGRS